MKKVLGLFTVFMLITGLFCSSYPYSIQNVFAQESLDKFPNWVRNVLVWYSQDEVSENDLVVFFQYMIDEEFITISSVDVVELESLVKTQENKIVELESLVKTQENKIVELESLVNENSTSIFDTLNFDDLKEKITSTIQEIQSDPYLDAITSSGLEAIPVAGPILSKIYENQRAPIEDKNIILLEILQNFEQMNKEQLEKQLELLQENKQYLEDIKSDTIVILQEIKYLKDMIKDLQKQIIDLAEIRGIGFQINPEEEIEIDQDVLSNFNTIDIKITILSEKAGISDTQSVLLDNEGNLSHSDNYLLYLANVFYHAEEYEQAISIYDKILKNYPDNDVLFNKGISLNKLGKYEDAEKIFHMILQDDPENISALSERGKALRDSGEYTLAQTSFENILNIDSQNTWARYNIAEIMYIQGHHKIADELLDKVLRLDPDYGPAIQLKKIISNHLE